MDFFDKKFKFIFNKSLDIINYKKIISLDNNQIIINYNDGNLYVFGEKLIVTKLLSDELLIDGKINKIEFR